MAPTESVAGIVEIRKVHGTAGLLNRLPRSEGPARQPPGGGPTWSWPSRDRLPPALRSAHTRHAARFMPGQR